jgi:hypothetical protein
MSYLKTQAVKYVWKAYGDTEAARKAIEIKKEEGNKRNKNYSLTP